MVYVSIRILKLLRLAIIIITYYKQTSYRCYNRRLRDILNFYLVVPAYQGGDIFVLARPQARQPGFVPFINDAIMSAWIRACLLPRLPPRVTFPT